MKVASRDYLVALRYGQTQIPVRTEAIERYVNEILGALFRKYQLPPVPVLFWEKPPDHLERSYGWFSCIREGIPRAVAICFNVRIWDGLNVFELEDILLHEFGHFLSFSRYPTLREENDGHGQVFYEICKRELGCNAERSSSHRQFHHVRHRWADSCLTPAKKAYLSGDLDQAKRIVREKTRSVEDHAFEAFLDFYQGDMAGLTTCLAGLREYIDEDLRTKAVWAIFSLKLCTKDEEAWPYLMHLKRAATMEPLAQFFFGKFLLEGAYGLMPSPEKGLFYVRLAMKAHFPPALALWTAITRKKELDNPAIEKLAELIRFDIGDACPEDLIPGGDCDCFVPFL